MDDILNNIKNIDKNILIDHERSCIELYNEKDLKLSFSEFTKKNIETRLKIYTTIQKIPEGERMEFIKNCFDYKSLMVREFIFELFKFVPENQVDSEFISKYLRLNGHSFHWWGILHGAISAIKYAPEKDRSWLIKRALGSTGFGVKPRSIQMVRYLPKNQQLYFIKSALKSNDRDIKFEALDTLSYMSKEDIVKLTDLITYAIEDFFPPKGLVPENRLSVIIKSIQYASRDKIPFLIQKAFKHIKFLEKMDFLEQIKPLIKFVSINHQKEIIKELGL